ncbi:Receptor-type guanylate cyclase gcy [Seminavis robusta]|uniref:Receptor-type guanylate cyclase gcy n=1 Tax=Seminavis robusta TaxID=568900 RepID=A0A9N8DCL8_9STRA|nr:Receptor-type guanylate cyclase gcy [Seminavis robusta]|eukprot:Sro58_g033730.1 Receptor-type guanylate cyclase gcy (896) ;mRNA; r:63536-67067
MTDSAATDAMKAHRSKDFTMHIRSHSSGDFSMNDASGFSESIEPDSVNRKEQQRLRRETEQTLAVRENRAVVWLRFLVMFLLIAVAALVSAGVFVYTRAKEKDDFEDAFYIHADQVTDAFRSAVERKLVAIGSLANAITTYALDSGSEFPFVTVSNFAVRGSDVRVLSDSLVIHWCPVVTEEKRPAWENYTMENRFKINEGFSQDQQLTKVQDEYFPDFRRFDDEQPEEDGSGRRQLPQQHGLDAPADANVLQDGSGFRPRIWNPQKNRTAEPDGTGPYLPSWQRTPVNKGRQQLINLNFVHAKVFQGIDLLGTLMADPKVIINRISVPLPSFFQQVTANIKASQYRNKVDEYLEDPLSYLAYPVFDSFNVTTRKMAGALISNLYWRMYFQGVLPSNARGIICVLSNSFGQTFSYRLDGHDVTILGQGDYHDEKYSEMMAFQDVTAFVKGTASPETRGYLTVPLHPSFGLYTLRVYPSQDTEDEYRTNKPAVYTMAVVFIFFVTALVFIAFERCVQMRQEIVMSRAVHTGAIVNSLFPQEVQSRMYDAAEHQNQKRAKNVLRLGWLSREGLEAYCMDDSSRAGDGQPIADWYKDATVMFADLKGFTAWSADRTPHDVFHLLECLYNSFDAIAMKRKVFKVETIGDCYLAVCGVPNSNPKHAVVMTRFSNDCLTKMVEVVKSLASRLGPETKNLQLRVGLHSGPVTAGVLRGQRCRFQLFGDTVNTASRIETTGQGGRIHLSECTAEELRAFGKGSWLERRDTLVAAKGKGQLQTYWANVASSGNDSQSSGFMAFDENLDLSSNPFDVEPESQDPDTSTTKNLEEQICIPETAPMNSSPVIGPDLQSPHDRILAEPGSVQSALTNSVGEEHEGTPENTSEPENLTDTELRSHVVSV